MTVVPQRPGKRSETFADHLGRRRYRLGKSKGELAAALGMSSATYDGWERGIHTPSEMSQVGAIFRLDELERQLIEDITREFNERTQP